MRTPRRSSLRALIIPFTLVLAACASNPSADMRVHTNHPKNIFIFIDGTDNTADTQTNVRRLYERLSSEGGERTVTIYLPGVGDPRHPISGALFGKGTDYRIRAAYAELMKVYTFGDQRPAEKCRNDADDDLPKGAQAAPYGCDDRIYIFGFSRGAHAARALAGLLSYAGIPRIDSTARTPEDYLELADKLNDAVKKLEDDEAVTKYWSSWNPTKSPPLIELASAKDLGGLTLRASYGDASTSQTTRESTSSVVLRPVRITFLGVWDTVPGSTFKEYLQDHCMEERGRHRGTRYKTNSYPTISRIAHAVSKDEKRSKFRLLRVCKPLVSPDAEPSIVNERIFPGAHSDVGGGYGDNSLPNLSLSWMLSELSNEYKSARAHAGAIGCADAKGLAHWSSAGLRNALFSCEERKLVRNTEACSGKRDGKLCVTEDDSVAHRGDRAPLAIGSRNQGVPVKYPLTCGTKDELRAASSEPVAVECMRTSPTMTRE